MTKLHSQRTFAPCQGREILSLHLSFFLSCWALQVVQSVCTTFTSKERQKHQPAFPCSINNKSSSFFLLLMCYWLWQHIHFLGSFEGLGWLFPGPFFAPPCGFVEPPARSDTWGIRKVCQSKVSWKTSLELWCVRGRDVWTQIYRLSVETFPEYCS